MFIWKGDLGEGQCVFGLVILSFIRFWDDI